MKKLALMTLIGMVLTLTACSDDDSPANPTNGNDTANFTVTIENIAPTRAYVKSGVFKIPDGDNNPGPATPGKKYQFTFDAGRSDHLSFSTMLAATNDLFYGPDDDGIALYDENGDPISGDVTNQVYLWDAGTEVNEEPAVGPNTITNQSGPDTGEEENGVVQKIENVTTGFQYDYPAVSDLIDVTITHLNGTKFQVSLMDKSSAMLNTSAGILPAPMSPGVYVVYNKKAANPLYTVGQPDFGQGVEAIAEDGNPMPLGMYVSQNTGVTYPASPGGWVVHENGAKPLFTEGEVDYGIGIEAIAEDGSAADFGNHIGSLDGEIDAAVMNTPMGSSSPGPILPGSKYQFTFNASQGDHLSFATMLAATNDIFYATEDSGIALFDDNGQAISGDITNRVKLWDAGTEQNEEPAIGNNTVTNQLQADTGPEETKPVRLLDEVNDGYTYPTVEGTLKVTITAN